MSIMQELVERIEERETKKRFLSTRTGWRDFTAEMFATATDELEDHLKKNSGHLRKATDLSLVRKGSGAPWPYRGEEALERVICVINDNVCNQYAVGPGKEAVDLVVTSGSGASKQPEIFIELKPWLSADNPAYALLELIKNYLLDKENQSTEEKRPPQITILAPSEYYEWHFENNPKRKEEFRKAVTEADKKLPVKISVESLNLERKSFLDVFATIGDTIGEDKWNSGSRETAKYDSIVSIDLSDDEYKDELKKEFKDSLSIGKWSDVSLG